MKKYLTLIVFLMSGMMLFAVEHNGKSSDINSSATMFQGASIEVEGIESDLQDFGNQDDEEVTNGEQTLRLARSVAVQDHLITGPAGMQIYNLAGQNVTEMNGRLPSGLYIVRVGKQALKVRID